jgi:uncharacterized membrane protein
LRAVETATSLLYPFAIYLGLQALSPRALAGMIAIFVVARYALRVRRASWDLASPLAAAGALVLGVVMLAALFDDGRFFKLAPVVVNVGLLAAFARSLYRGPSLVEALARLRYSTLPAEAVGYCRRVTACWCVFFALNAAFILWLAVAASLAAWTLYTGLLAYFIVGVLFGAEWLYRTWRFRHPAG